MSRLGVFYGVGIGPGDPELMTLKARRVLSEADVVFVPKAKITDEGLALGTLLRALGGEDGAPALRRGPRELVFPMSKDPEVLAPAWEAARDAVLEELRAGRDCAFITLGDTALYSTYMNLLEVLRTSEPGLAIVTVPGVSSYSQAAAEFNLSLAEKSERMAVLPCLGDVAALAPDLERFDSVVLMKVGRRFAEVRELLRGLGLLPHARLAVRLGSLTQILSSDLDAVDPAGVGYMSLVIVRKPFKGGYA